MSRQSMFEMGASHSIGKLMLFPLPFPFHLNLTHTLTTRHSPLLPMPLATFIQTLQPEPMFRRGICEHRRNEYQIASGLSQR